MLAFCLPANVYIMLICIIFDFGRAEPSLHVNDKDKQIVSMVWTGDIRIDFKRRDTLAKRQTK